MDNMCPHPSVLFLLVSLLVAEVAWSRKGPVQEKAVSLIAGTAVSLLNTIWEWIASIKGFYYISGPVPLLATPLPMAVAWALLAFSYCEFSEYLDKRKTYLFAYVVGGIIGGWGVDFLLWKMKILIMGSAGHPAINMSVWVVLVPASLGIRWKLKKLLLSK